MSEAPIKEALRALTELAIHRVAVSDTTLENFSGAFALLDPERDQILIELPAFEAAQAALSTLPVVQDQYGATPDGNQVSAQLVIQFVYGFLGNLSEPAFNPNVFETTWEAFWSELLEPEWTYLGLANLQNFRSESRVLDMGDGITIRGRSYDELAEMGWTEGQLAQLEHEWLEGGVNSSHVILTEYKMRKAPDNLVLTSLDPYYKALQALQALRLHKDGDVGIGQMWLLRPARFKLSHASIGATGFPSSMATISPGNSYTLSEPDLSAIRDLYNMLVQFQSAPNNAPVNLGLALRSFSDIYERQWFRPDTRLIDTITAAEALLGPSGGRETTFRLAFRTAAILGKDDDERVAIFEQMKGYYDTRSRVVHGDHLSNSQRQRLQNQQALRQLVRRLLAGFLRLTLSTDTSFSQTFFRDRLDSALLHSTQRSQLRIAMGLERNSTRT